jgi:hemolysin III
MLFFDLREPISALSHGMGMVLALAVSAVLWNRCARRFPARSDHSVTKAGRYERIKALCLLIFGGTMGFCYGVSACFHGASSSGELVGRLQRLDHVGIYLLIAGTYTPVAWSLMRGSWWWGTLTTVWTFALLCAARVWCGGVMPSWVSTLLYLTMGWGALFCYFELARTYSHHTLRPLPLGGVFYSVGAIINLAHWPVVIPGVFAAHELFHFLVLGGSACHIYFMVNVVVPSIPPGESAMPAPSEQSVHPLRPAFIRGTRWLPHFPPHPISGRIFLPRGSRIARANRLEK